MANKTTIVDVRYYTKLKNNEDIRNDIPLSLRKNILSWLLMWASAHTKTNSNLGPTDYFLALNTLISAKSIIKDTSDPQYTTCIKLPLIIGFDAYMNGGRDNGLIKNKIGDVESIPYEDEYITLGDRDAQMNVDVSGLVDAIIILTHRYKNESALLQIVPLIMDLVYQETITGTPNTKGEDDLFLCRSTDQSHVVQWIANICRLLDKAVILKKYIQDNDLELVTDNNTTSMKILCDETTGCKEMIDALSNPSSSSFDDKTALYVLIASLYGKDEKHYRLFTRSEANVVKLNNVTLEQLHDHTIHMPRIFFPGNYYKDSNYMLSDINLDELETKPTLYSNNGTGNLLTIYNVTYTQLVHGNYLGGLFYSCPSLAQFDRLVEARISHIGSYYYMKTKADGQWTPILRSNPSHKDLFNLFEYSLFTTPVMQLTIMYIPHIGYYFNSENIEFTPLNLQDFVCNQKTSIMTTADSLDGMKEDMHNQLAEILNKKDYKINGIRLIGLTKFMKKNNIDSYYCTNSSFNNIIFDKCMPMTVIDNHIAKAPSISIFNHETNTIFIDGNYDGVKDESK